MSLRAMLLHGCRFRSLCLVDVVAIGPFGRDLFRAVEENPACFEALPDVAFEGIVEGYVRHAAFHELAREDLNVLMWPWIGGEDNRMGKKGFVRQMCQAGVRSTDAVEGMYAEVGKVVPVKVIWGAQDRWIAAADAYRLGEALGAEEVVVVEGAGHLIMYDQPERFGIELAMWLSAH